MSISLDALSITSCIKTIEAYFNSQENNSKWTDLTKGSEGVFLIRMLANIMSNISYRNVVARRENYLSTANLLSSNIGIAVNLGYSAYRGNNQKRRITVTPTQTVTLPKLSVLGAYNDDYDIISLDTLSLSTGVTKDVETVIGKVKELNFTAGTTDIKLFQQFTENISEDYILYKDDEEVPTSSVIRDLADDFYLVRTNPFSSVDILYLNNKTGAQYTYGTETVFTLKYVELAETPTIPFTSDMFTYFTLDNTRTIEDHIPAEDVSSIKTNAPLNHETQNLIRSKEDFVKRLPQINTSIKYGNYNIITPTYLELSYYKNKGTLMSPTEKTSLMSTLDKERFLGTPLPDIVNPKKEDVVLDIYLKLLNNFPSLENVNEDVQNILSTYYTLNLSQTINIFDLEKSFEELSYVKYARVSQKTTEHQLDTPYVPGDIVLKNGTYYKAEQVLGESGTVPPSWNVPLESSTELDTGLETLDNKVIWKTVKKLNIEGLEDWQSSSLYKIGDYVTDPTHTNYMFKCVDLVKSSADTPSSDFDTPSIGDYIEDGEVVWITKVYNDSNPTRMDSTDYRLGDSVKVGSYSFECIGYAGKTGSGSVVFEETKYTVSASTTSYFDISGDYTNYFKPDDALRAYINDTQYYTYTIDTVSYEVGSDVTRVNTKQVIPELTFTELTNSRKGTRDKEIFWNIVDDLTEIKYGWNVYNVFKYNLTT
jgi:hypothetical protein